MKREREMTVSKIRNGTVIDHLDSKITFKIVDILNLACSENVVSVATNLFSEKIGRKGIIKISQRFLNQEEVNKIAIISHNATLCIIRDYEVESKTCLEHPNRITKIIRCGNPNCITNSEDIETVFNVLSAQPLKIRCHFCENTMDGSDLSLN